MLLTWNVFHVCRQVKVLKTPVQLVKMTAPWWILRGSPANSLKDLTVISLSSGNTVRLHVSTWKHDHDIKLQWAYFPSRDFRQRSITMMLLINCWLRWDFYVYIRGIVPRKFADPGGRGIRTKRLTIKTINKLLRLLSNTTQRRSSLQLKNKK